MHVVNALFLMLGILLILSCIEGTNSKYIPTWFVFLAGVAIAVASVVNN